MIPGIRPQQFEFRGPFFEFKKESVMGIHKNLSSTYNYSKIYMRYYITCLFFTSTL